MREERSVCRYCPGACGMVLTVDDDGRLAKVRGDRDHLMSQGYACIKGLQAPEAANGDQRILRPLKRMPDGTFAEIPLATALDEIAAKLAGIIAKGGGRAVASYRGTLSAFDVCGNQMIPDWLKAIGSPSFFTNYTIDQSAKSVTAGRLGAWRAGKHRMTESEVLMLVGTNPLLAISTAGYIHFNVLKQLKAAKARGMKLIVVDPRRTETAEFADLHLRPHPGEDPAVFAGILRIVLAEGWHDAEFCARHVSQLDQLRAAVEPFTPAHVEARAGIPPDQLMAAAAMFARDAKRGFGATGTGATMSPASNLIDHLVETLNVVCGRMQREGEVIPNPPLLSPRVPIRAQVVPPTRSWEGGHQGRMGFGTFFARGRNDVGQMMSATLADEILTPGEGRIRALIVQAGNPAMALPDQEKAVAALRDLDLLVTIDPHMSATARLSHYVIPPKTQYERADVLFGPGYETTLNPAPFQQYIHPVCEPPPGAEVIDDWQVYWELARRLGVTIDFAGVPLEGDRAPVTDDLLAILMRHSQISLEDLRGHPGGRMFDLEPQRVEPAEPGDDSRFEVAPNDVLAELAAAHAAPAVKQEGYSHLLTVRRMREVYNSFGQQFASIRERHTFNPAYLHPHDMADLGLAKGDGIELVSPNGRIPAIVEPDARLMPGTVSIAHCWGGLPDEPPDYRQKGSSTNLLISGARFREAINAMPWMTAAPVNIVRTTPP